MRSIAVIGSFRRFYTEICDIIKLFESNGVIVTSPSRSKITKAIKDFVIFETDDKSYNPVEIQMITLEKILKAEIVYVFNPEGYIGKTTCYEIGFCLSRYKPIYFYQTPDDLPIPIEPGQVVSPTELIRQINGKPIKFFTDYDLCDHALMSFKKMFDIDNQIANNSRNIVICGSMVFYHQMVACKSTLQSHGVNCIVPKDESDFVGLLSQSDFLHFKKKVSKAYLKKIRDRNTYGVLVFNETKNDINNYIGANTLVELATAFMWNRKIFLLNDIYIPLKDELISWGCISLNGDLGILIEEMKRENKAAIDYGIEQLSFFKM